MNKRAALPAYLSATYACQVIAIVPLSSDTFSIELQASLGAVLEYHAGQYLQLELDVNGDGQMQTLSYTIANSPDPDHPRRIELFIQNGSEFAQKVMSCLTEHLASAENVNVSLAMGRAFLQTDLNLPHTLIAAGSGISKINSITTAILRRQPDANVKIYWSNKAVEEFYLLDRFNGWAEQYPNLSFTPILEAPSAKWQGRTGYIYEVIAQDNTDLTGVQTYLCGSPAMVYGTIDQLAGKGLEENNCYSDVFEFAPRNKLAAG